MIIINEIPPPPLSMSFLSWFIVITFEKHLHIQQNGFVHLRQGLMKIFLNQSGDPFCNFYYSIWIFINHFCIVCYISFTYRIFLKNQSISYKKKSATLFINIFIFCFNVFSLKNDISQLSQKKREFVIFTRNQMFDFNLMYKYQ